MVGTAIFIIRLLPQNAFTLHYPRTCYCMVRAGVLTLLRHVRREFIQLNLSS